MISLQSLFPAILFASSGALDIGIVEQAVSALVRGDDPYLLDSVEPRDVDADVQSALKGCQPKIAERSTRSFVTIDFLCTEYPDPYAHRVLFTEADSGKLDIWIDPLPAGIGPTAAALATDKMPRKKRQFSRFVRETRGAGDPTLGGLVPLNDEQLTVLRTLADCQWNRSGQNKGVSYYIFVKCPDIEEGNEKMITIFFDSDSRAEIVRIENGKLVRVS